MKKVVKIKELEELVKKPSEIFKIQYSNTELSRYLYNFSKKYLYNLSLPPFGKVVMLGSFDGFTLKEWKQHFGTERVLGYDIINPNNTSSVIIKDISNFTEKDDYPCALVCNDLPNWILMPKTRKTALEWSLRNIVLGGFYIDYSNHRCCWDLRGYMLNHGFEELVWTELLVVYKRVKLKKSL